MTTEQRKKNEESDKSLYFEPEKLAKVLGGGINSYPFLQKQYETPKGGEKQ